MDRSQLFLDVLMLEVLMGNTSPPGVQMDKITPTLFFGVRRSARTGSSRNEGTANASTSWCSDELLTAPFLPTSLTTSVDTACSRRPPASTSPARS